VRLEIGGVARVFQDQPGIAVVVELTNLIAAPAWRPASWSGQSQQLCAELRAFAGLAPRNAAFVSATIT